MNVKTDFNKYYVVFELDRRRSRAVTKCKIFLLLTGKPPRLWGKGEALQGKKDDFDIRTGCKFALMRALANAQFNKTARTAFWREFNRTHPEVVTCEDNFNNVASYAGIGKMIDNTKAFRNECHHRIKAKGSGKDWCSKHSTNCCHVAAQCQEVPYPASATPGYGGHLSNAQRIKRKFPAIHAFQQKASDELRKAGGGPAYLHLKHEYHDEKMVKPYVGEKKKKSPEEKQRLLREKYDYYINVGDYSKIEEKPSEYVIINNVTSHEDALKELFIDRNKAKIAALVNGGWVTPNTKLTAKMLQMSISAAEEANEINAKLRERPGIKIFMDEYIVNPDEFVPAFKAGEVVTYKGDRARVYSVDGPLVTITTCKQKVYDVFDHELEKPVHWLRRLWRSFCESAIDRSDRADAEVTAEDIGRGLYKMIEDNYCDGCHGRADFLQGPRGGSCSNVKCKYCGQKYWLDPLTQTAKKID